MVFKERWGEMSLEIRAEEFSGEMMWYPGCALKYQEGKKKKENEIDEIRLARCW